MFPFSLNKSAQYSRASLFSNFIEQINQEGEKQEVEEGKTDYDSELERENINYVEPNMDHKFYTYPALSTLNMNIDDIPETGIIRFCEYSVNTEGNVPFLQFAFVNHMDYLGFISTPYNSKDIFNDLENFRGFLIDQYITYIFIESKTKQCYYSHKNSTMWTALVDEIVNKKKVDIYEIDQEVYHFFTDHPEFLFLKNKQNEIYETPTAVYYGMNEKSLKFVTTISVPCQPKETFMGANFYFTDYNGAVKNAVSTIIDDNQRKGALTRHALVLGKMKVITNHPDSPIDESEMKKQLLEIDSTNKTRLTMRISDHDSRWTENYDSVYIGKLELDDGSVFTDSPIWVTHNFDDNVLLSWSLITKAGSYI